VASLRRVGERREATQEEGVIWKKEGCCKRFFLQSSHDLLCSRAIPIGRPPLAICTVAPRCLVAHDGVVPVLKIKHKNMFLRCKHFK
jgi:hypothetical protein